MSDKLSMPRMFEALLEGNEPKGKVINEAKEIISKEQYEEKKKKFFDSVKSKLVYLNDDDSRYTAKDNYIDISISFSIRFSLKDKYIDDKTYNDGSAWIYPSEELYSDIEKKAKEIFGVEKVMYNNTKTYGWFRL